jgi:hypothetical protein
MVRRSGRLVLVSDVFWSPARGRSDREEFIHAEGSGGRSAGINTWILLGETLGFWVGLRSAGAVDGMMVQKSGVRGFPGGRRGGLTAADER